MNCKKCGFHTGASALWDSTNEYYYDVDGTLVRCPVCGSFFKQPSNDYIKRENKKRKEKLKSQFTSYKLEFK